MNVEHLRAYEFVALNIEIGCCQWHNLVMSEYLRYENDLEDEHMVDFLNSCLINRLRENDIGAHCTRP
jgi:hypothetical protein